jgi:hypothetical protein
MKNMKKTILYAALFSSVLTTIMGLSWPNWLSVSHPNPEQPGTRAWLTKEMQILESQADNIDPAVLRLSLNAYLQARHKGLSNKSLLTVIDYSKPSSERRLWVFDLKNGKTLFNTWVSHGKNSGGTMASSFSNSPGSLKSSIGVFITDSTPYMGGNGYSLRLRGLESGINDNAYNRDIVVHGARYVNAETARRYGQVGRSWGCPAVSDKLAAPLINTIKDDTVLFAYYPDHKWLSSSQFLA